MLPAVTRGRCIFSMSALSVAALGCDARATDAQCKEMLDHYVDMTVAGDPSLADLGPEQSRTVQATMKARRKAAPAYAKAETQCTAEISRREYRCAMKTFTPETWQACID